MGHPNERVIREWIRAVSERDLDVARALLDASVIFHLGGRNPIAGDYVGRDHVLNDLFRRLTHVFDRFDMNLHDVVANDEHAVALIDRVAKRGSRTFEGRVVGVYHVHGGRITEAWIQEEDQQAFDEFSSS